MNTPNNKDSWWKDIRYRHERKVLAISSLGIITVIIGVIGLAHSATRTSKPEAHNEKKNNQVANQIETKSATIVTPKSELDEIAQDIVLEQLNQASTKLKHVEIQVNRLKGIIAWKEGNISTAETLFATALALDPNSIPELVNLAGVKLLQNNAEEAEQLLQKARNLNPGDPYIANRHLMAKIESGNTADVKKEIRITLDTSPENGSPSVLMAAAAIELAEGNTQNAKNFLQAGQSALGTGIFYSLLAEKLLAKHASNPELQEFFSQSH